LNLIPTLDRAESVDASLIAQHPATRAWRKLMKCPAVPEGIEIIQERLRKTESIYRRTDKACVYRLMSVGPDGAHVIAKRCESAAVASECLIYDNVLPYLPVSALRYYGLVPDDDQQFCWLFLEDAGEQDYCSELEEHRVLAGHWLGTMNVSAQKVCAAAQLPDRGSDFYLATLLASRETLRAILLGSKFNDVDSAMLRAVISHCDILERRWDAIERICSRVPRTLVHGDFAAQNARVRSGPTGESLIVLDWEEAGWGVPAIDLAQFVGTSLSPDLRTYYAAVQFSWPHLALADFEKLTAVGRIFRLISSLDWTNCGYRYSAADWYIEKLRWCEHELAQWLRVTEAQAQ
jgi:hypothetical protein